MVKKKSKKIPVAVQFSTFLLIVFWMGMHNYYLENKQTTKEKFNRRCYFPNWEMRIFSAVIR